MVLALESQRTFPTPFFLYCTCDRDSGHMGESRPDAMSQFYNKTSANVNALCANSFCQNLSSTLYHLQRGRMTT